MSTTAPTKSGEVEPKLPPPYNWWWHPDKSWTDMLVCLPRHYLMSLETMVKLSSASSSEDISNAEKIKEWNRFLLRNGAFKYAKLVCIPNWSAAANAPIFECKYLIPTRTPSLLHDWGLFEKNTDTNSLSCGKSIEVVIRFPSSAYRFHDDDKNRSDVPLSQFQKNDIGCYEMLNIDLGRLSLDVPFIIQFFGGMTIGTNSDVASMKIAHSVAEFHTQDPRFVFACVSYSQTPEFPFPTAVIQALTAVSYILEKLPKHKKVFIFGYSAGANLATVVTLEMHRQYPGRIQSAAILCPMLNPAANSLSYYLNQKSMYFSVEWLRWCWRVYLGLSEPEVPPSIDPSKKLTREDQLNLGSNHVAWENSSQRKGKYARLVNPMLDMPSQLNEAHAPRFLVTTNEGDPLRDDGLELVQKLRTEGASLVHLAHKGSHWIGTSLDKKNFQELIQALVDLLYPIV
jgi:acetyl esterase/lipase